MDNKIDSAAELYSHDAYVLHLENENKQLHERIKNLEIELALVKREVATGVEFLLEDEVEYV